MATVKWLGGATAVAQVSTVTLNNDFNDSETDVSLTLTAEDGTTTQSVSITPSGTDESTIAASLQSACAASNQSLFQRITFTVASNVVTLTAKVAGVPFYFESAVTGGAGTTTDATGTANAGPNDWNTAANWSTGSVPTGSDNVVITEGAFDILYGLDQSSVSLAQLAVNRPFTGTVGDPANGYYLRIDATDVGIRASNQVLLDGAVTTVVVSALPRGSDAFVLKESGTYSLYITGSDVLGEVRLAAGAGAGSIWMFDCPSARLKIDDGSDVGQLLMGAGTMETESDVATFDISGGRATFENCGVFTSFESRGGQVDCRGVPASGNGGKWPRLTIYSGSVSYANTTSATVTIAASNGYSALMYGGSLDLRSGLDNITFDGTLLTYGGRVLSEQGQAFDPTP